MFEKFKAFEANIIVGLVSIDGIAWVKSVFLFHEFHLGLQLIIVDITTEKVVKWIK